VTGPVQVLSVHAFRGTTPAPASPSCFLRWRASLPSHAARLVLSCFLQGALAIAAALIGQHPPVAHQASAQPPATPTSTTARGTMGPASAVCGFPCCTHSC
jgi:hypothetical protein